MREQKGRNYRHQATRLNTSGVADIAFLVLIFFLITASKMSEQGIQAKLPPYSHCGDIGCFFIKERNILRINLDETGQLLVNKKEVLIGELKSVSKAFITNPNKSDTLSESPNRAMIYFFYKKETPYNKYLMALNEMKGAYHEIWDKVALKRFGYHYKDLNKNEKRSINNGFPEVILEADLIY